MTLHPALRGRIEAGAAHLHALGPRPVAELLIALAIAVDGFPELQRLLDDFARLPPSLVHAIGADRYSARRLRAVPADLMRGYP